MSINNSELEGTVTNRSSLEATSNTEVEVKALEK